MQFEKFIDNGHQSHVFYTMPTSPTTLVEKISNLDLLLLSKVLKAHLENQFPSLVIFHGETGLGKVAQCHLFVPESETRRRSPPQASRTYVFMFGQVKHPVFKPLGSKFLNFAKVVVEQQDPDILRKIYSNTP